MDFDITSTRAKTAAGRRKPHCPDTGDMIFDVTGSTHASTPVEQPEVAKPAEADDGGMEFTLDFPVEK